MILKNKIKYHKISCSENTFFVENSKQFGEEVLSKKKKKSLGRKAEIEDKRGGQIIKIEKPRQNISIFYI